MNKNKYKGVWVYVTSDIDGWYVELEDENGLLPFPLDSYGTSEAATKAAHDHVDRLKVIDPQTTTCTACKHPLAFHWHARLETTGHNSSYCTTPECDCGMFSPRELFYTYRDALEREII